MSTGKGRRYNIEYVGLIPRDDLINYVDLAALVGLTVGIPLNEDSPWMKFTIGGEDEVYIPQKTIRYGMSWNQLNTIKLTTGKEVTIGGENYIVRLMSGRTGTIAGGEWNKYIYPVWDKYGGPFTVADLALTNTDLGRTNFCSESADASLCICRGQEGPESIQYVSKPVGNGVTGWRPMLVKVKGI